MNDERRSYSFKVSSPFLEFSFIIKEIVNKIKFLRQDCLTFRLGFPSIEIKLD